MAHLSPPLPPPLAHRPHFASGTSDHRTATPGTSSGVLRPARHQAPPQLSLLDSAQLPADLLHRAPQLHTRLQHLHRAPGPPDTLPPASDGQRTRGKATRRGFERLSRREGGTQQLRRSSCLCFRATHQLGVFVSSYALHHSLAGINQNHRGHDSCSSGTSSHSLLAATVISWRVTSTCVVARHRPSINTRLRTIFHADAAFDNMLGQDLI